MKTTDPTSAGEGAALEALLESESPGLSSGRRLWLAGGLVLVVALAAFLLLRPGSQAPGPSYRTEPVAAGKLVVKVSATGNLQPTNKVEVGSELSGTVEQVLVDDNDQVKKGQVLARLDLSKLNDAVARSRASLAAAQAAVLQADATAAETRAALARYQEVSRLSGGKVPSRSELDGAEANLKRAEANLASARASVVQARANLQSDETNLGKASIRSPIDGVVLSRGIEPGQTVAASLQAPVLFTLAEDLAKMELEVKVDEADVAQVKTGQHATFTVDAWPNRKYDGVITRVAYGSQTTDGVVSYPTVIGVQNDDLSLRPGMTATAEIVTVTRESAVLVPNAALRFTPAAPSAPPAATSGGGFVGKLMPRPPGQPPRTATAAGDGGAPRVWVLRDGQPAPVDVETGASNGQLTEIVGGKLEVGAQVITEAAGGQP